MTLKYICISLLVGAGLSWYFKPVQIKTETKVVVQQRVVTIHEHTTTHPDGTIETEKETTEREASKTREKNTVTLQQQRNLVLLSVGTQDFQLQKPIYKLELSHQLLGPFSVSAFVTSNNILGIGLGVGF